MTAAGVCGNGSGFGTGNKTIRGFAMEFETLNTEVSSDFTVASSAWTL